MKSELTPLQLKIYEIVRNIPRGKVCTYARVAKLAGNVKLARVVGNVMHKNPLPFWQLASKAGYADTERFSAAAFDDFEPVPCHRVVNSQGKMGANFGMGGPEIQAQMLRLEGVKVENGKVSLKDYGYF